LVDKIWIGSHESALLTKIGSSRINFFQKVTYKIPSTIIESWERFFVILKTNQFNYQMASSTFKFFIGWYPKTEDIEKKRNELIKEYEEINQYAISEELTHYLNLDKFVSSKEFAERKSYYENLGFPGSDEEKKEKEYHRLVKWHEIKFYYKFKASPELAHFQSLDGSKEIADFEQQKAFVESAEFKKVHDYMNDKKKWEKSNEYRKLQEFEALSKNPSFIAYFKFIKAKGYADFTKMYQSTELAAYETREKYLHSIEFGEIKASKEFKKSDAYTKYKEFEKWRKSSSFKHYFSLKKSDLYADFKKLRNSEELSYYNELEAYVKSDQFKQKKKQIESLRFEQTDEYKKLQEYKRLASSGRIKKYYKTKSSEALSEYRTLEGSKLVSDYEALEKYIKSEEFIKRKAYLLDKKKWQKTEEFKKFQEYLTLKKAPKIIWYFKVKDSHKYDELKTWNLAFEDDFTSGKIDKNKWINRYFWGEKLLNDSYALPGEKHFITDGKNLELNGSTVKILTKPEKITGKEWNPSFGFIPKQFDYTSGLLSSGDHFRTKFGKVEAKIKLESVSGIFHAFWLAGDTMVPQIDVFKLYDNKLLLSTFWGHPDMKGGIRQSTTTLNASKFVGKQFIFSIEWDAEKIVWRINNLEVKTQTENIPQNSMYVTLNSGVLGEQAGVSSKMEIDWIRCYQKVDTTL
jgi:hypothetical protein